MHHTETNLIEINNKIKNKINSLSMDQYNPKVIAVSKTFKEQDILPLLDYGHCDFGENKVQEALLKWPNLKEKYKKVKLPKKEIIIKIIKSNRDKGVPLSKNKCKKSTKIYSNKSVRKI